MLTERFNSRGRTQLEELEKITTTQVSLYLTGIANDITTLAGRVSELEDREEERTDKQEKMKKYQFFYTPKCFFLLIVFLEIVKFLFH